MHVLAAVVIVLSLSASARANPEFLPEAIAFGAKDCLFCHTDPGGGRTWNDRGHWLMARKQESGQETVAVSWLEDYVAPSGTELNRVAESEGAGTGPRNVPETYHQGPFFEPVKDEAALQRWIDSRGKYTTAGGEWPQYSGDVASSKYSPLDQIHGENVTDLEVAWTWDAFDNSNYIKPGAPTNRQLTEAERRRFPDGFKATPLMVGGKLFIRTNFSGVAAIDPATGTTLWTHDPGTSAWGRPAIFGFATRGLGYWSDGDQARILLCTGDSYLVALDPASGEPVQSFGDNGRTDLTVGSRRPLIRSLINCSAPPTIIGDVAVVGNQIQDGPPGKDARRGGPNWKENWPVGDVRGYDIRTGKRLWTFHTIPQEGEFGNDTWEGDSWKWMGNTNVWSMMSAD
ncbi:MAG: PQQ-binding-like beta-propeller repeat protein, partial [Acidobacteriia bacterium]|nr:PQQ-binding-like beta-propeller repeat protein [Terriglobia bacterium]